MFCGHRLHWCRLCADRELLEHIDALSSHKGSQPGNAFCFGGNTNFVDAEVLPVTQSLGRSDADPFRDTLEFLLDASI